jgi:AraC-like DNA-binding protein
MQFDSAALPSPEAFAAFSAMSFGYEVALPDGAPLEDFSARTDAWLAGGLVVTYGHMSPMRLTRTAAKLAADGLDTLSFTLMTRGGWRGEFGPQSLQVGAGQICIVDFTQPWATECVHSDFIVVVVSRAAMARLTPPDRPLHGRLLDGVTGRLLAEHLGALVRHLPEADMSDLPGIERATLALMGTCLERLGEAPPSPAQSALAANPLRDRVRSYIENHLSAPDLSPARIVQALAISRPTLYRAFAGPEGVAGYIQRRRLEALHILLSHPAETRSLPDLALAFGFSSYTHFSRAFRRRFGYAPRDARSGARAGGPSEFQNWLLPAPPVPAPRV